MKKRKSFIGTPYWYSNSLFNYASLTSVNSKTWGYLDCEVIIEVFILNVQFLFNILVKMVYYKKIYF